MRSRNEYVAVLLLVLLLALVLALLVIDALAADKRWKDAQGRTNFRVSRIAESGKLLLEPMTPLVVVVDRVEGKRAIQHGDVFQDCYFDILRYEVDPDPKGDGSAIKRITLALRCKDYLFQVTQVAVPLP